MAPRAYVQRRRIFVGCEGHGERGYAALVSNVLESVHHGVHIDARLLRPGGGDALALCQVAESIIKREERNREPYASKYLLLDNDKLGISPARDNQIGPLVARIDATIIWQEPCHEAMLLRHLANCQMRRPATTALATQQLSQHWPSYQKPMSAIELAQRLDHDALRRAAQVEEKLAIFLEDLGLL